MAAARKPKTSDTRCKSHEVSGKHAHEATKMGQDTEPKTSCMLDKHSTN